MPARTGKTARSLRVTLAVTGSIAAVKAPELVRLMMDKGWTVRCVLTSSAAEFVSPMVLATFSRNPVAQEMFGADAHTIPHLRLAEETDVVLIAPASAATLARCATGLAEDLVSLIYLATRAPVFFAPAMHAPMWSHPATRANAEMLKTRGARLIGPVAGPMADGSTGVGRMSEPAAIVAAVSEGTE